MDLRKLLAQDPIAEAWTSDMCDLYVAFYERLGEHNALTVKIGKGGLSFYKAVKEAPVFVCHYNALPRRARPDIGFADFQFEPLQPYLKMDAMLRKLQRAAPPEIEIKVNKMWCSLHFLHAYDNDVADLLTQHIVSKVK
jgi:hypothetical protein